MAQAGLWFSAGRRAVQGERQSGDGLCKQKSQRQRKQWQASLLWRKGAGVVSPHACFTRLVPAFFPSL